MADARDAAADERDLQLIRDGRVSAEVRYALHCGHLDRLNSKIDRVASSLDRAVLGRGFHGPVAT